MTIIGGSGFIGKSFIDAYQKGNLKKFKIKGINILSRSPQKILKEMGKSFKGIKIFKGDISNLKNLPKSELIIYASEPANIQIYSKKIVTKYNNAIKNFYELSNHLWQQSDETPIVLLGDHQHILARAHDH